MGSGEHLITIACLGFVVLGVIREMESIHGVHDVECLDPRWPCLMTFGGQSVDDRRPTQVNHDPLSLVIGGGHPRLVRQVRVLGTGQYALTG